MEHKRDKACLWSGGFGLRTKMGQRQFAIPGGARLPWCRLGQMLIRLATLSDVDEWAALRAKLWSDTTFAEHRKEVLAILSEHERARAVFDQSGSYPHDLK